MSERPPLPHDEKKIKSELQGRLPAVLAALGYNSQDIAKAGALFTPLCPWRGDRHPGSFVIWLQSQGGGEGSWKDFATSDKGDLYDLIRRSLQLARWIDAYWWSLDFLGLGRGEVRSADQAQRERERAEADRKAAIAKENQLQAEKAAKAKAQWLGFEPNVMFTPAWTYLTEARLLPMGRIGPPNAMRVFDQLEHFDKATGEITEWPGMGWAVNGPLLPGKPGDITGVHLTWLQRDGLAKAPVVKPKKMRGVIKGGSIRVSKGASRLTPEKAAAAGKLEPLIITEGIEDALTAAIATRTTRTWAAGSLSLMHELVKVAGWPLCASAVTLVRDNDWEKPEAVAAFDACLADWKRAANGRPLHVVQAEQGKDLNDWLRSAAVA